MFTSTEINENNKENEVPKLRKYFKIWKNAINKPDKQNLPLPLEV
jgi:hypothetical protein